MENIGILSLFVLATNSVLQMVRGFDASSNVNIALGKPANQSSTYVGVANYGDRANFLYSASLAVDGNEDTDFHKSSCSNTDAGYNSSWWEVDLEGLYSITRIKIFQRSDELKVIDRNVGSEILGKLDNEEYELLTTININTIVTYDVESNNTFKAIKLKHSKLTPDVFLCLCEVEVFAVNVAKGKNTSQSSTYVGSVSGDTGYYDASFAVDGNTNTDFLNHSCSSTNMGKNQWWKVDLQGLYAINAIRIFQRKKVNEDWLSGYALFGRRSNGAYDIIKTPAYHTGVIQITLSTVKVFSEIMIQLNSTNKGICLCEVQVFKTTMCPRLPTIPRSISYVHTPGIEGYGSYNSTVIINCIQGYKPQGSTLVRCIDYNIWDDVSVQCLPITCNMPELSHAVGKYTCTGQSAGACDFNSTLTIHCNTGYRLYGEISNECLYTGQWSGTIGVCTDIDECMNKTACNVNAECHNAMGNYSCTCKNGFTGTGTVCKDIDECIDKTACDVNAECHNAMGNYSCTCKNGFSRTGTVCKDIDECIDKTACDVNAECHNAMGNYSCTCKNGFTRTGTVCKDIDECIDKTACDVNALCYNAMGNYSCTCKNGFTGSGSICKDIDECIEKSACDANAECHNDMGNYSCSCKNGFTGTGTVCKVIHCDVLPLPEFGTHKIKAGIEGNWTYNTTVAVDCNPGYSVNGDSLVECTNFGNWNGTLGNCSVVPVVQINREPESSVAGVAGGVTAAMLVIVLVVIIAIVFYKRRTRGSEGREDKMVDTTLTEIPSSSEGKEQKEKAMRGKSIYAEPKKINHETKRPVYDESKHVYMNSNERSDEYYSFTQQKVTDKHSIRVEDLSSLFLSRKISPGLYEEEYNKLPDGLTKSHEAALLPENRSKNRYKNIYPYDETRVILEIWDPTNENDYINACYVDGFNTSKMYIAAQGPTKGILNDFWRMIWQTKCSKIVMLTNLTEEGKHKCEQYWPDDSSMEYGDIVVRLFQCETFSDFTIRRLSVGKINGKAKEGKTETRQINQFHFTAWPDRGVPRFASSLVHFRQKIRASISRQKAEGPMVIHCSAGIGRTGTFLALDYLLDQAKMLGYINVVKCLETLRQQRVNLVQTLGQYIFLHEALLEALTSNTMAVSTSEFQETCRKLLERDNKTGKLMLDDEFEKLPLYVSDPEEDVYENAKNMANRHKNRYSNILPDRNHCPFLNVYVKGRDSYINAVFLPAYKENNIFIITQTPLENTIVDFWRMVYQFDVGSIVMLNTLSEMKEEERYWTEDKKMLEIGPFKITLESKSSDDICTNYTMLLNYQDERRRVRLSRADYWADGKPVPLSPTAMLKQIDLIEKWQQESGSKPIIVHCMNGAEKSGLFCVIFALLERTKIEQDVAVEQIIKQMRSRRPQIIPNLDQFKFCYEAMLAYLNQFDTYSNFTGL